MKKAQGNETATMAIARACDNLAELSEAVSKLLTD